MKGGGGRVLVLLATIAVAAVIVLALRMTGAPSEARERRIDAARVEALSDITRAMDVYHSRHKRFPVDLRALRDDSMGNVTDPETGEFFEYRLVDADRYELCATFANASDPQDGQDFWAHRPGRACYQLKPRMVDHRGPLDR